ncbi:MAG: TfoX/Sxy family protein [Bauldia sp.]|nr:TfoX/Sxy family protein [Bauldia sp.]
MATEFQDFARELFEPFGGVVFRRMFGGVGIFREGMMFALIIDDVLYLKADEATRQRYEAEGSSPFSYDAKGREVVTSYWRLPDGVFDEPERFMGLAREAFAVAERAQARKPVKGKKGKAKGKS